MLGSRRRQLSSSTCNRCPPVLQAAVLQGAVSWSHPQAVSAQLGSRLSPAARARRRRRWALRAIQCNRWDFRRPAWQCSSRKPWDKRMAVHVFAAVTRCCCLCGRRTHRNLPPSLHRASPAAAAACHCDTACSHSEGGVHFCSLRHPGSGLLRNATQCSRNQPAVGSAAGRAQGPSPLAACCTHQQGPRWQLMSSAPCSNATRCKQAGVEHAGTLGWQIRRPRHGGYKPQYVGAGKRTSAAASHLEQARIDGGERLHSVGLHHHRRALGAQRGPLKHRHPQARAAGGKVGGRQ